MPRYYRVRTDYQKAEDPLLHIEDDRDLVTLADSLHSVGYLVSTASQLRWAFSGYRESPDAPVVRTYQFSAEPIGQIMLLKDHVVEIAEHVVPDYAEPFPD